MDTKDINGPAPGEQPGNEEDYSGNTKNKANMKNHSGPEEFEEKPDARPDKTDPEHDQEDYAAENASVGSVGSGTGKVEPEGEPARAEDLKGDKEGEPARAEDLKGDEEGEPEKAEDLKGDKEGEPAKSEDLEGDKEGEPAKAEDLEGDEEGEPAKSEDLEGDEEGEPEKAEDQEGEEEPGMSETREETDQSIGKPETIESGGKDKEETKEPVRQISNKSEKGSCRKGVTRRLLIRDRTRWRNSSRSFTASIAIPRPPTTAAWNIPEKQTWRQNSELSKILRNW
jgi:hypothetical protein